MNAIEAFDRLIEAAKIVAQQIAAEAAQRREGRRLVRNTAARERYARRKAKGTLVARKKPVLDLVEHDYEGCTCHLGHPRCYWCVSGAGADSPA